MDDSISCKPCKRCGGTYPATLEFFHKAKGNRDRLYNICKKCIGDINREKYLLAKNTSIEAPIGTFIVCSVCQILKLATDDFFTRDPRNNGRYGFSSDCRICRTKYSKDRRQIPEVKKKQREFAKNNYYADPVRARADRMEYYYTNKEAENARSRAYGKGHRTVRSHQRREYRQTRPGSRTVESQKRRALKKSVQGTHTAAQILEQLERQHYRCYYAACGFAEFPKVNGRYMYQIDHTFPISRVAGTDIPANDISYIVLACGHCNNSKGNKFPWEWPEGGRLL